MSDLWDEHAPGGHPSRAIDRGAWEPELERAVARRLEADALAAEVAERTATVRFVVLAVVGVLVAGLLLWLSLRTGG